MIFRSRAAWPAPPGINVAGRMPTGERERGRSGGRMDTGRAMRARGRPWAGRGMWWWRRRHAEDRTTTRAASAGSEIRSGGGRRDVRAQGTLLATATSCPGRGGALHCICMQAPSIGMGMGRGHRSHILAAGKPPRRPSFRPFTSDPRPVPAVLARAATSTICRRPCHAFVCSSRTYNCTSKD